MRYLLFVDTETTGLAKDLSLPPAASSNWPRLVELGFLVYSEKGKLETWYTEVIEPEGFTIPEEAVKIHSISTARAIATGIKLTSALSYFKFWAEQCDYIIAHNLQFDKGVLDAEYYRAGIDGPDPLNVPICTKELSTSFCALPSKDGKPGYKKPSLQELHAKLFGKGFKNHHYALNDAQVLAKCFFKLKELNVISLDKQPAQTLLKP
jgi:DNA polymerase III epsilon subunit-like protein